MEPGAYTPTLVPNLTFTVGDGWELIADTGISYFMLHRETPETGFSIASPVLRGAGDVTIGSGRQAFADFLGSVQGLEIVNTTDVSVGGLPAKQLDVKATTDLKSLFVIGQSDMPAEIAPYYELLSGRVARVYAVDAPGSTVIIVIEPGPGTTLEAALPITIPMIESIDFQ